MSTIRLTTAQALIRYMAHQKVRIDGEILPIFAGVWAIFGHGNVAALGEALYSAQDTLPTYRGHNEQTMAHAAIAYAKSLNRKRMMAVTTSIGPGATNMVTAAALAHVNRLPVLLLPGDTFANRRPDPVLQQVEAFGDPTITANDSFKPVSRYWDRITRPEQLLSSLPRAMSVLTDAAECGPATLSLCQDVQAEAYDYPLEFFAEKIWEQRRPRPDRNELETALKILKKATKPLIISGGGVLYGDAVDTLENFVETTKIPVAETQAGKGALPWNHPQNVGSIGVTGSSAANKLAEEADVILAVGTRLQDFISGSRALFNNPVRTLIQLNNTTFDGLKHQAIPLICDAREGLDALHQGLSNYSISHEWHDKKNQVINEWQELAETARTTTNKNLPSDAQVLGAVNDATNENTTIVCAAGGLPGELHKLWRTPKGGQYHVEYGYSCMGYEIAGGLGVKMAHPDRDVVVMVGDGSYMMANSEIATSVMLGLKIILVILDNRGFGCINRLQMGVGSENFNNLLDDARHETPSAINFTQHAASMGATSEKVASLAEMAQALERAKKSKTTYAIVIDTDPLISTEAGGTWWDVAVPEVSTNDKVKQARVEYEIAQTKQRLGS